MNHNLSARPIALGDVEHLCDYWSNAGDQFLRGMGADPQKMPPREQFRQMLTHQVSLDFKDKQSFATIWELDGQPIGHCNVNKIIFGKEAYMHLHLWNQANRKSGMGQQLVKLSLPWFFDKLQLETLYCEPYALNPAPNKTFEKAGFEFVRSYICIPGTINFEQEVNLWRMERGQLANMQM